MLQEAERIEIGKNAQLVGNFASEKELFLLFSRFARQLRSLPFYFDRRNAPQLGAPAPEPPAVELSRPKPPPDEDATGSVEIQAPSKRALEVGRELPDALFFALVLLEREARNETYGTTSTRVVEELVTLLKERDLETLRSTHRTLFQRIVEPGDDLKRALAEQMAMGDLEALSFEERIGLLVEREIAERSSRQLTARLRKAKLREQAAIEDIDWRTRRGLDKGQVLRLASCQWIGDHLNVLITGKTGLGKTFLACALGHRACREGYSVAYLRLPRLLRGLTVARGDGSYERLLHGYARTDLLILDDWGLSPLAPTERRDLLEILEDRYGHRSPIVASQLPVDSWHDVIGDPTLADAILDRLVHGAYRLAMDGESMRSRPRNGGPTAIDAGPQRK